MCIGIGYVKMIILFYELYALGHQWGMPAYQLKSSGKLLQGMERKPRECIKFFHEKMSILYYAQTSRKSQLGSYT